MELGLGLGLKIRIGLTVFIKWIKTQIDWIKIKIRIENDYWRLELNEMD